MTLRAVVATSKGDVPANESGVSRNDGIVARASPTVSIDKFDAIRVIGTTEADLDSFQVIVDFNVYPCGWIDPSPQCARTAIVWRAVWM